MDADCCFYRDMLHSCIYSDYNRRGDATGTNTYRACNDYGTKRFCSTDDDVVLDGLCIAIGIYRADLSFNMAEKGLFCCGSAQNRYNSISGDGDIWMLVHSKTDDAGWKIILRASLKIHSACIFHDNMFAQKCEMRRFSGTPV